jgi:thiamine kinase-like enzyme
MLELTLQTDYRIGTNLSGSLARADWRFLMPSLQLKRILCIGNPAAETLAVFTANAQEVVIASNQPLLNSTNSNGAPGNRISHLSLSEIADDSVEQPPFDLIYITQKSTRDILNRPEFLTPLGKKLTPNGRIFIDVQSLAAKRRLGKITKQLNFSATEQYWVTPFSGEVRTAVPTAFPHASSYLFENVLFGQSIKKRLLSNSGKWLSRLKLVDKVTPRQIFFLQPATSATSKLQPPQYLQAIAAKGGYDIAGHTFAFSARGKYNSNKVIFFLFSPEGDKLDIVAKMTRSEAYNARLQNEYKILTHMKNHQIVPADSISEAVFFDIHNRQAAIGLKAIHGVPFRVKTTAQPDCPLARQAGKWLVTLAQNSAFSHPEGGHPAGKAMFQLFEQFRRTYDLPKAELQFLEAQISKFSDSKLPFPTVLQHGDPGTWNMMVNENNNVIVIDWESGELEGMPLWDLFYFYRTWTSWIERKKGNNNPIENFAAHFFHFSPVMQHLQADVQAIVNAIKLDAELVSPLFYTCWMHRALKESMRLSPETLSGGTFVSILRACIAHQNDAAFTQLINSSY